MKFKWFVFLGVSALMLVLAGSAVAQPTVDVNVPFAFTVNHTVLPAGSYTVVASSPDLLLIQGASAAAFVQVIPDDSPNVPSAAKLTFERYGNTYLLSAVSAAGERWEVPITRAEVTMAKNGKHIEIGAVSAR